MRKFLRTFFYLLYNWFAFLYELIAWVVSAGRWQSWVEATIPFLFGDQILELGFGPGRFQLKIASTNTKIFGIDASSQMTRLALNRLRKAHIEPCLVQGLIYFLPYPEGAFSSVISTFPSEYITDERSIKEIFRVLRQPGKLIILPSAGVTDQSIPSRLSNFLFWITKQNGSWDKRMLIPFVVVGFKVESINWVTKNGSEILVIVLEKN